MAGDPDTSLLEWRKRDTKENQTPDERPAVVTTTRRGRPKLEHDLQQPLSDFSPSASTFWFMPPLTPVDSSQVGPGPAWGDKCQVDVVLVERLSRASTLGQVSIKEVLDLYSGGTHRACEAGRCCLVGELRTTRANHDR
jgi:hypothetical protein